ncbi:MAG: hypothetical protein HY722_03220 [Planctomycetes bacterium]|nr:hypothetical protein [Planctomycetota bacterium]
MDPIYLQPLGADARTMADLGSHGISGRDPGAALRWARLFARRRGHRCLAPRRWQQRRRDGG